MGAPAEQDWQQDDEGGLAAPMLSDADRDRIATDLGQTADAVADSGAEVRSALLHRAWALAEHLCEPVDFLVIGGSAAARDAMRFLAGMAQPIPDDLAAVVACIRIQHGYLPELVATSGSGLEVEVPDEPIMLTPHAPVTLTYDIPANALHGFQLTHLRNLAAGFQDEAIDTRLARADGVIWLTEAATPWTDRETALFDALPPHLTEEALLVLTDADQVTDVPELRARFDAKVDHLASRFSAIVPIALDHALTATPGGTLADAGLFSASGGHALLTAVHQMQTSCRAAKDEEAVYILQQLGGVQEQLRADADTQARQAEHEAMARQEAAATKARAEAEAEANAKANAEAIARPDPATPTFPRPDETALAILREEAERETAARRQDVASATEHLPEPSAQQAAPDEDSILGYLKIRAAEHAERAFDPEDADHRREAFDDFLQLVAGLSRRLRDTDDGAVRDRQHLLDDLEEAEDTIMMLSFEGDTTALDEVSDLVAQLIGDVFDRLEEILSG